MLCMPSIALRKVQKFMNKQTFETVLVGGFLWYIYGTRNFIDLFFPSDISPNDRKGR